MSDEQMELRPPRPFDGPPSGYFVVVPGNADSSADGFARSAALVAKHWKLILVVALIAGATAAVITLQMRNIYRAQALIAPVTQSQGGGGSLANSIGGIAALAGIDIGDTGTRKAEYLATLTSASLAREFIKDQDMLPLLYPKRWDAANHAWKNGKPPFMDEAVKKLSNNVLIITENHTTSIVTVNGEWYSPELAARWANRIIEMANDRLRLSAQLKANRSIEYLNQELAKTNVEEMRVAIFHLVEDQLKDSMLANVQREYAYQIVDPALPPDVKYAPKRSLITLGAAFGGAILAAVFVLVRNAIRARRART
jgi:uncharacterized protein involved in exopolysaccharide biosynthesis